MTCCTVVRLKPDATYDWGESDAVSSESSASSTISFNRTFLPLRQVASAVKTRRDPLAWIRSASAFAPKPAKITEWIAPMRTVASISVIDSGQGGM